MPIRTEDFYARADKVYHEAEDDLINGRDTQKARDLKKLREGNEMKGYHEHKIKKVIEEQYTRVLISEKKHASFNNHNLQYRRYWEGELGAIKKISRELLGKKKTNEIIEKCEEKVENMEVE